MAKVAAMEEKLEDGTFVSSDEEMICQNQTCLQMMKNHKL
jgi:hypothetical protein